MTEETRLGHIEVSPAAIAGLAAAAVLEAESGEESRLAWRRLSDHYSRRFEALAVVADSGEVSPLVGRIESVPKIDGPVLSHLRTGAAYLSIHVARDARPPRGIRACDAAQRPRAVRRYTASPDRARYAPRTIDRYGSHAATRGRGDRS